MARRDRSTTKTAGSQAERRRLAELFANAWLAAKQRPPFVVSEWKDVHGVRIFDAVAKHTPSPQDKDAVAKHMALPPPPLKPMLGKVWLEGDKSKGIDGGFERFSKQPGESDRAWARRLSLEAAKEQVPLKASTIRTHIQRQKRKVAV
jgi:hypothetical protein